MFDSFNIPDSPYLLKQSLSGVCLNRSLLGLYLCKWLILSLFIKLLIMSRADVAGLTSLALGEVYSSLRFLSIYFLVNSSNYCRRSLFFYLSFRRLLHNQVIEQGKKKLTLVCFPECYQCLAGSGSSSLEFAPDSSYLSRWCLALCPNYCFCFFVRLLSAV